jgi:hypothetical protein
LVTIGRGSGGGGYHEGGRGGRGGGGDYRGGGGGGRGGRGRDGRGGRGGREGGRGGAPDVSRNIDRVLTNILAAKLSENFSFYLYTINTTDKTGTLIDSRSRRMELFGVGFWDILLADMPKGLKSELKRMVFFAGSFFFSAREIPGLEPSKLPLVLCDGSKTNGDTMSCVDVKKFTAPICLLPSTPATVTRGLNQVTMDGLRCSNCTRTFINDGDMLQHCKDSGHVPIFGPAGAGDDVLVVEAASVEVFVSYVSLALERAMGERLSRWGRDYVDREAPIPAKDRNGNDLGVSIFEAISLAFGVIRVSNGPPVLALTCDLRAKVIRTVSVLDCIYENRSESQPFTKQDQTRLKREWIGSVVIYKNDHKCKYEDRARLRSDLKGVFFVDDPLTFSACSSKATP